jgi:hypothetical protein
MGKRRPLARCSDNSIGLLYKLAARREVETPVLNIFLCTPPLRALTSGIFPWSVVNAPSGRMAFPFTCDYANR